MKSLSVAADPGVQKAVLATAAFFAGSFFPSVGYRKE